MHLDEKIQGILIAGLCTMQVQAHGQPMFAAACSGTAFRRRQILDMSLQIDLRPDREPGLAPVQTLIAEYHGLLLRVPDGLPDSWQTVQNLRPAYCLVLHTELAFEAHVYRLTYVLAKP